MGISRRPVMLHPKIYQPVILMKVLAGTAAAFRANTRNPSAYLGKNRVLRGGVEKGEETPGVEGLGGIPRGFPAEGMG